MADSRISKQTGELIEQLTQLTVPPSTSSWPLGKGSGNEKQLELIRQISERGEPIAAAWLFPYALDRSTEIATAAANAMKRFLLHATSEDVLWLERRQSWSEWLYRVRQVLVSDFKSLRIPMEDRPAVWTLATLSWNGHVRESAIENLIATHEVFPIPFVLLRLNDWVCQVRDAAKRYVSRRMEDGRLEQIAQHSLLVCRLNECGRDDHSDLVRTIMEYVLARPSQFDLSALLNGPHRRLIFRIASEIDGPHRERIADLALACCDTMIRLQAIRKLPDLITDEPRLRRRLDDLAKSHSASIRRAALSVICQRFPAEAECHLLDALFDPSQPIRELAQFTLRKSGIRNLAERYRSALGRGQKSAGAISGLGATGTTTDAPLIQPFLNAPASRVRKTAVTALGRLLGDDGVGPLLPMLTDHSPKVGRAAFTAVGKSAHLISAVRLEAMFASSPQHSQIFIVELLVRLYEFVLAPCQLAWLEPKIGKLRHRRLSSPFLSSSACRLWRQAEEEGRRCGGLLASSPVSFTSQTSWLGSTHTVELDKMNFWNSLPCSLRIIASGNATIARRACELLGRRLNRVFTTPTSEQRQQLESLLDGKTLSLPQGLAARLREWLKYR